MIGEPPSATVQVRRIPGVQLSGAEIALLKIAFADYSSMLVERVFRSGYSGALVALISVGSEQAPVVVKLAAPGELQREYNAYQQFVVTRAPQNSARLYGEPLIGENGQLGLLRYAFAGNDSQRPSVSLYDYYQSQGATATAELLNRIFRLYGRHWWAINTPRKFVLGEEYDRLLPVHLQVRMDDGSSTPDCILRAGQSSILDLRSIGAGMHVQLCDFQISKLNRQGQTITLVAPPPEGEASPPLRIRVELTGPIEQPLGAHIPKLQGVVTATRQKLLNDAASTALPGFDPNALLITGTIQEVKSTLESPQLFNPVRDLHKLLDRVVEMRTSTIHGDLNLQNVLVDAPTGFAWLIDFAETRHGPTLFDLQRLEVQVLTKLLPDRTNATPAPASTVSQLLLTLHSDPPPADFGDSLYHEPYILLAAIRRLARHYLMDDLEWDEYYLGLIVALVGALKFEELTTEARQRALLAAGTLQALLGKPLRKQTPAKSVDPHVMPSLPPLAKPPEPTQPPTVIGFVGRDAELAVYAEKLERQHLAIISGMAGIGKTALAATLTRWVAKREQIFWHSFHEGDGIEAIIWKLAGFLAWQGRDTLWQLLERVRQTEGQPPPFETLIDYLLQLLRGQSYLLCFDDFHFVEEDPAVEQLMERLLKGFGRSDPSILITTRRTPRFVGAAEVQPLSGLNLADTRRLLAARGVVLEESALKELLARTAGNAQFLTLATNILQQANDPMLLLERLAETDDVERYLLSKVDEGMSGLERSVMGAVALLLGYPGTRDAIEAILNAGNIWRTLHLLHEHHLLSVSEGERGKEYSQHAMVQSFYYQELSRRQRRQMHHRAGEFYEHEEPDLLRSAIHYERAAAFALAAKQATFDVWAIINRGQTRVLRRLLEQLRAAPLDLEQKAEVNLASGLSDYILGERQGARQRFAESLATLETLPPQERVRTLKARVYCNMGELLELENPEEALVWVMHGLEEADEGSLESAALQIKASTAQLYLGKYDAAQQSLEAGLQLLQEGPSQLRILALINLGSVAFFRGKLDESLRFFQSALEISQQLHDHFRTANILSNLAIEKYCRGDWPEAIADFKSALALAESLGSEQLQAEVAINLGAAYLNTGDYEDATQHLNNSLRLAQQNQLHVVESFAQFRLADLHLRLGEWATAAIHLSQAENVAQSIRHLASLIAISRGWAELFLVEGKVAEALERAEFSLQLAQELAEELEQGESLRTLGRVLIKLGKQQQALEAFEQSLLLLIDEDPYEAARTMVELGALLLQAEDPERGRQLLQDARHRFQHLNAKQDLQDPRFV